MANASTVARARAASLAATRRCQVATTTKTYSRCCYCFCVLCDAPFEVIFVVCVCLIVQSLLTSSRLATRVASVTVEWQRQGHARGTGSGRRPVSSVDRGLRKGVAGGGGHHRMHRPLISPAGHCRNGEQRRRTQRTAAAPDSAQAARCRQRHRLAAGGVALVVGASGGIGQALLMQLQAEACFERVLSLGRHAELALDLCDEASIAAAAARVAQRKRG